MMHPTWPHRLFFIYFYFIFAEFAKARQARAGKEGMPLTGPGGPADSRYLQQGMGMMGGQPTGGMPTAQVCV